MKRLLYIVLLFSLTANAQTGWDWGYFANTQRKDLLAEFQTNLEGTFIATLTPTSGIFLWDYGDGSDLDTTNTPSHIYSDGSTKTVKLYQNSASTTLSTFSLSGGGILTYIDLSWATINGNCIINNNVSVDSVLFSNSNSITQLDLINNGLVDTLWLDGVNISATFRCSRNSNLVHVEFSNSNTMSNCQMSDCDLRSIDFTNCTLSGILYTYNNNKLSNATFGSSNGALSNALMHNCNFAALDFSSFTSFTNNIQLQNNIALMTIGWGQSIQQSNTINLSGCALTEIAIDSALCNYYTWTSTAVNITADQSFNLSGGTNSAPSAIGAACKTGIESNYAGFGRTSNITVN